MQKLTLGHIVGFVGIGVLIIVGWLFIQKNQLNSQYLPPVSPSPMITQIETAPSIVATVAASLAPSASPSAKIPTRLSKTSYTIAAFGDSMIDTMGENMDYLQNSLKTKYPGTNFKLYNYGIGSQNVVEGLNRFHSAFNYKTRQFPPIDQIQADVIILGSFSYNPLSPYDRVSHQQKLAALINEARSTHAAIYILAEIAPLKTGFGKGPGGIDWQDDMIKTHVEHIIEQLDDTVSTAQSQQVYLINAYKASQVDGKYGNRLYVTTHDGIHPSVEGQIFVAQMIASSLKLQ
jgi:lysophospholipase L1-like esterase